MGLSIIRFKKGNQIYWGKLIHDEVHVLKENFESLGELLNHGINEIRISTSKEILKLSELNILSPVTKPTQIVCQGANYSTHREEAGLEAERPPFNLIFSKADSSLTGPYSDIIQPEEVKLLDYEIELGLIIGKKIKSPLNITDENLHEFVAGIVLVNDISARDIQLPQGQWLKGKSYRTFCPTGPILYLLDQEDIPYIHNLNLNLWVNDELRQSANTSQMLFKPSETLSELSEIMDLIVGDMVITGTTGGVALNLTPELMSDVHNPTISYEKKIKLLLESQLSNNKYLKPNDIIRAEISSPDGVISLGSQINKVIPEQLKVSL